LAVKSHYAYYAPTELNCLPAHNVQSGLPEALPVTPDLGNYPVAIDVRHHHLSLHGAMTYQQAWPVPCLLQSLVRDGSHSPCAGKLHQLRPELRLHTLRRIADFV